MTKLKIAPVDKLAALDTVIAVHDEDSQQWAREITAAFERYGGVEKLIYALAELVCEGYDVEHRGDWVAVRTALRHRRELQAAQ